MGCLLLEAWKTDSCSSPISFNKPSCYSHSLNPRFWVILNHSFFILQLIFLLLFLPPIAVTIVILKCEIHCTSIQYTLITSKYILNKKKKNSLPCSSWPTCLISFLLHVPHTPDLRLSLCSLNRPCSCHLQPLYICHVLFFHNYILST